MMKHVYFHFALKQIRGRRSGSESISESPSPKNRRRAYD